MRRPKKMFRKAITFNSMLSDKSQLSESYRGYMEMLLCR